MRPTTWLNAINGFRAVIGVLVGVLICGSGVWLLVSEVQAGQIHRDHIYISAALIGFGSILIVPSVVLGAAREIPTIMGTYLPMFGGRRPADPPVPPKDPPVS